MNANKLRSVFFGVAAFAAAQLAPHPAWSAAYSVVLTDQAPYFTPQRLRVPKGSTVTWENKGPALTHTIFFVDSKGGVHSGPLPPHQSWSYTFAADTVVKTSCEIHPYMYGVVIVGAPSASLINAIETTPAAASSGIEQAKILEFPLPVADSVPGIIAIDAQDNAWLTMGGGGWGNINHPPLDKFARLTIDGDISIFSTPSPASGPSGLIIGERGDIFITELMAGKIARFNPASKQITEVAIPTNPAWPTGLALTDDGGLWFNETKGNKVGLLSPGGTIREFPVPTEGAHPTGMTLDKKGTVWIAERDAAKVARLAKDGSFVEFALPTAGAKPAGMTVDARGRVWVAEREGNKLAMVENDSIREFELPNPRSGPMFLTADVAGNVWFSEVYASRIGVFVAESESFVEFALPTSDAWPGGLAFDSQGNLWFTEQLANKVGVLRNAAAELAAALARRKSAATHHSH